jgi:serine protease Do
MRHIGTVKAVFTFAAVCGLLAVAASVAGQTVFVRPSGAPGRIGVATRDVTSADVTRDRLPGEFGAYVNDVEGGSPAEKAGIRLSDVIVEFDGVRVRSSSELQRLVRETPPGRSVKLAVVREGKRLELTVTTEANASGRGFTFDVPPLGRDFDFQVPTPEFREGPLQRPFSYRLYPDFPPNRRSSPPVPRSNTPRLGIGVQDLTPQLAEYFHTKEGVLVATVEDGSPAARAGIKAGDIIASIDGHPVAHADDVRSTVHGKEAGDEVTLGIARDGKPLTVKVKVAGDFPGARKPF